uniref:Myb/SANT-like domain-containing protein n=1 Tax=Chenopodium quinoa TaxID=63459 RepID=A0A803N088_CHEQI
MMTHEMKGMILESVAAIIDSVLALFEESAVDFDTKFTYVLVGWEGYAHDFRVLNVALSRGFKIPEGKYYLADAGFGNCKEEVRKGNRPNNTFRTCSFVVVAKKISEKFRTLCTADHVDNHMRIVRANWGIISKIRGNSGFGWDDTVKMVTSSNNAYNTYIQVKIWLVETFLRVFLMLNLAMRVNKGSLQASMTENGPLKSDSATSSKPRQHHKRTRGEDDVCDLQQISNQLGEVVSALKKFSNNQLDVENFCKEIMKMDDFEEVVRDIAFDHLVKREMLAKAFLTKRKPLRRSFSLYESSSFGSPPRISRSQLNDVLVVATCGECCSRRRCLRGMMFSTSLLEGGELLVGTIWVIWWLCWRRCGKLLVVAIWVAAGLLKVGRQ